jgi:hypothetical protein
MGAEKRDIWDRGDGFNAGLNSPKENQQLLDGLAGHSDGSIYGQIGASVRTPFRATVGSKGAAPGFGLLIALLVVAFVLFDAPSESTTTPVAGQPIRPLPAALPPAAVEAPAPRDDARTHPSAEALAAPHVAAAPVFERVAVQRQNVQPGEHLELHVHWMWTDGRLEAIELQVFIIGKEPGRLPAGRRARIFPGETHIRIPLPADAAPGQYQLESVWRHDTSEWRSTTGFTVYASATGSQPKSTPALQQSEPSGHERTHQPYAGH